MRTNEIAQAVGVHVNTVRLYEEWGYIAPVPRLANGYRDYSELHLQQMRIARLAFQQEFIQHNLRKMATDLVQKSGAQQFAKALVAAHKYEAFLKQELLFAQQAVEVATELLTKPVQSNEAYTHKQVATRLQLTEEVLRNWERNDLYEVARNAQNRRSYYEQDIQKLLIIRVLRCAHYSIASILQLFTALHTVASDMDMRTLLNDAPFSAEFYHVTDELERNLQHAIQNVQCIQQLLMQLQ
ncbi:MAG: MerR family transcriptional regulator [Caryophanon sp.]|nr:MerR family transcriptional regulator [Caryophanon sp.]